MWVMHMMGELLIIIKPLRSKTQITLMNHYVLMTLWPVEIGTLVELTLLFVLTGKLTLYLYIC